MRIETRWHVLYFVIGVTAVGIFAGDLATQAVFALFGDHGLTGTRLQSAAIATIVAVGFSYIIGQRMRELHLMRLELEQLAMRDPLTDCLNRRAFAERVEEEQQKMRRTGGRSCLLLLDVDHFKRINDTHGHIIGDEALVEAAARIRSNLRPGMDSVARWGGEEFAVLVTEAAPDRAAGVAERLRRAIGSAPFTPRGAIMPLTISIGVAELHPDRPFESAIEQADAFMYRAKSGGRNRVVHGPVARVA